METIQFQVRDWTIQAVVAGAGQPIVLLHGIGASREWWSPTIAALSAHYLVCAVDLPGAGRSSTLRRRPDASDYAALVTTTVEVLNAGPAVVVGHSLGGFVAVQAAIAAAPGIRSLLLIAPGGFGPVENPYFRLLSIPLLGDLLTHTGRLGRRILLRSLIHRRQALPMLLDWANQSAKEKAQFLFQLRLGINAWGETTEDFRITHAYQPSVPLLLIWGAHDSVFSLKTARRAQACLGQPPLCVFPHAGHFPQIEEEERFIAMLCNFVRGT